MKFHKGDRVTHACGSSRGDMHAEFDHYIEPTTCDGERRVSVTYKTPLKWGKKGDWLERYCIPRGPYRPKPSEIEKPNEVYKPDSFHKLNPDVIRGTEAHIIIEDKLSDNHKTPRKEWLRPDDSIDATAYMAIDWAKDDFKPNSENTVKATIKEIYVDGVLTETWINDRDMNDMSASDLLNYIGNTEAAIEKLTKHNGAKSKFIGQEMTRLTNFVESVYLLLDEKFYVKPEQSTVDKSAA